MTEPYTHMDLDDDLGPSQQDIENQKKLKKQQQQAQFRKVAIPASIVVMLGAFASMGWTTYQYINPPDVTVAPQEAQSVPQSVPLEPQSNTATSQPAQSTPVIEGNSPNPTVPTATDTETIVAVPEAGTPQTAQPAPEQANLGSTVPLQRRAPKTETVTETPKTTRSIKNPFGSYQAKSETPRTVSTLTLNAGSTPPVAVPAITAPRTPVVPLPVLPTPKTNMPKVYVVPSEAQQLPKVTAPPVTKEPATPPPPRLNSLEQWVQENQVKLIAVTIGTQKVATFETQYGYLSVNEKETLADSPYQLSRVQANRVEITGKNLKMVLKTEATSENDTTLATTP